MGLLGIRPGEDPMRYIEELEDWSNYVIPEPPAPSTVTPNLLSVELNELPMDGELEGYMGKDYKASLVFNVR